MVARASALSPTRDRAHASHAMAEDKENIFAATAVTRSGTNASTKAHGSDHRHHHTEQRLETRTPSSSSAYDPRVKQLTDRVRAMASMTPSTATKSAGGATSTSMRGGGAAAMVSSRAAASAPRRGSVEGLLEEYCGVSGDSTPVRIRNERNAHADAIRANTESPEAWLLFLENEEAIYADDAATADVGKPSATYGSRNGVSLHRLYELATKTIPRRGNVNDENYVRIFLGLARQQMVSNMDDARDTFKFLKSCGIGHKHAIYWCEWAAFGYTFKGEAKAVKILKRGLDAGAEPAGAIECMLADIEARKYDPVQQTQHTPFRSLAPQYTSAIKPSRHGTVENESRYARPAAPVSAAAVAMTPKNLSQRAAALASMQATPTAKLDAPVYAAASKVAALAAHQHTGTTYMTSHASMPPGSASSYQSARTGGLRVGDKTESSMPPPPPPSLPSANDYSVNAPPSSTREHTTSLRNRLAGAMEKYGAMSAPRTSRSERTPSTTAHTPMDPPRAPALAATAPRAVRAVENTPTAMGSERKTGHAAPSANKYTDRPREDENTVIVNGVKYTKLECIGQGGTCKVFKVVSPKRKILALKRIRLDGRENETIAGFIDEIKLLKTLRGRDNIIQLIDAEVCMNERLIFMVLEFGEIDLAHMLAKREKQRQGAVGAVDDNFLRLYFEQMVEAVNTIHEERIVHSDLKPANFLFVEGALKLIDFGIARAIQTEQAPDHTNIVRDHQVGTVNYMSPEAILNGQASALGGPMKVGRSSDIWSLGCILYQMVYGHTPFSKITGMIQKLHAITDPRHVIAFPPLPVDNPALIDLMQACLERNPKKRISVKEILTHKFLRPFADQSSSSSSPTDSGLSMTQLQELLAQLQKHGSSVDVNAVTAEVFRQISAGESVSLSPLLRKHRRSDEDVDGVTSTR